MLYVRMNRTVIIVRHTSFVLVLETERNSFPLCYFDFERCYSHLCYTLRTENRDNTNAPRRRRSILLRIFVRRARYVLSARAPISNVLFVLLRLQLPVLQIVPISFSIWLTNIYLFT